MTEVAAMTGEVRGVEPCPAVLCARGLCRDTARYSLPGHTITTEDCHLFLVSCTVVLYYVMSVRLAVLAVQAPPHPSLAPG